MNEDMSNADINIFKDFSALATSHQLTVSSIG